jgi:hypothetical protein
MMGLAFVVFFTWTDTGDSASPNMRRPNRLTCGLQPRCPSGHWEGFGGEGEEITVIDLTTVKGPWRREGRDHVIDAWGVQPRKRYVSPAG